MGERPRLVVCRYFMGVVNSKEQIIPGAGRQSAKQMVSSLLLVRC